MHPHTRSITHKRAPAANAATHSTGSTTPKAALEINDEELSHLAKDLAYFRAERYREVDENDVRKEDIRSAAAEIAALVRREDSS